MATANVLVLRETPAASASPAGIPKFISGSPLPYLCLCTFLPGVFALVSGLNESVLECGFSFS